MIPRIANPPGFVEEVLRDDEWLRDPTAKARMIAQEVIEEFKGGGETGSEGPSLQPS